MCKRDEGYREEEIIEETGWCKECKLDCKYAGHELRDVDPDYPYGERKF